MKGNNINEYLSCKFCRGYYSKKSLRRHVRKCHLNPESLKRFQAQNSSGSSQESGPVFHNDAFNKRSDEDVEFVALPSEITDSTIFPNEDVLNEIDPFAGTSNLVPSNSIINMKKSFESSEKRIRRKHRCTFCALEVGDFARHLQRIHSHEIAVQEALKFGKNTPQRKQAIDRLRKEGDFYSSSIVPVTKLKRNSINEYLFCKFCRGYYSKKSLRRHVKKCHLNPDPLKRFRTQSIDHALMSDRFGPNDILRTSELLDKLAADNVSLVAKEDTIICEVGRRYLRRHKEKHLVMVAKRHMRRLARLLIEIRRLKNNKDLKMLDILKPTFFKTIMEATRSIAEYDFKSRIFKSPSLALQMGALLKSAVSTAHCLEIQKTNVQDVIISNLNALSSLMEKDWAHEITTEASQNLYVNKFNKPLLVPDT